MTSFRSLAVALVAMAVAALASLPASSSSSSSSFSVRARLACTPQDQPNPIAHVYPNIATGLLNATLAIVPIPLATARALVPPQWPILEHVYRAFFAALGVDFPADAYPLLAQAALDHDIRLQALGLTVPDFQRFSYEFPFVDRLGDNHSSFRWVPAQIITAANVAAVAGSAAYGTRVALGDGFDPPCDAYAAAGDGSTFFRARSTTSAASVSLAFRTLSSTAQPPPYPLDVFRNMTNQPTFASGLTCDSQVRFFDTDAFFGAAFPPRAVTGTVASANMAPLDAVGTGAHTFTGVHGWQLATPFTENNYLPCKSLRGYSGVALPGY